MHIRWFGNPWPSPEHRAPICEDELYKVQAPVGEICLECEKPIEDGDTGVVMAASPEIKGSFENPLGTVCAEHLECFLLSILGPDFQKEEAHDRGV